MVLAGLCLSRTGVDIALVSAQDAQLRDTDHLTVDNFDFLQPSSDALLAPFRSFELKHPRELAVLTTSPQMCARHRLDLVTKLGFTENDLFNLNHIDAYLNGTDVGETGSCLLFIEFARSFFCARFVTTRWDPATGRRIAIPLYTEGSSAHMSLVEFINQVLPWTRNRNYTLSQCVILDPPVDQSDLSTVDLALSPGCSIVMVTGADLARYAARYTFSHAGELRDAHEDEDMHCFCSTPAAIYFSVNQGPPVALIPQGEWVPASRYLAFDVPDPSCKEVVIDFALGHHEEYPDDPFQFARLTLTLDNVKWEEGGERKLNAFVSASEDWVNSVAVFQGEDKMTANAVMEMLIPDPFHGRAMDAFDISQGH